MSKQIPDCLDRYHDRLEQGLDDSDKESSRRGSSAEAVSPSSIINKELPASSPISTTATTISEKSDSAKKDRGDGTKKRTHLNWLNQNQFQNWIIDPSPNNLELIS